MRSSQYFKANCCCKCRTIWGNWGFDCRGGWVAVKELGALPFGRNHLDCDSPIVIFPWYGNVTSTVGVLHSCRAKLTLGFTACWQHASAQYWAKLNEYLRMLIFSHVRQMHKGILTCGLSITNNYKFFYFVFIWWWHHNSKIRLIIGRLWINLRFGWDI